MIADAQLPLRSRVSSGMKARSRGSIGNSFPPKLRVMTAVVVHGTVHACPLYMAPGISLWSRATSCNEGKLLDILALEICYIHLSGLGKASNGDKECKRHSLKTIMLK